MLFAANLKIHSIINFKRVVLPQLALPAILTNDLAVRTRIQAIFQAFGSVASLIITAWALPILDALGGKDNAAAWFKFTVIFGTISMIIYLSYLLCLSKM